MNGLEAIAANNGWTIAALGISIVFSALTLLSITIAQLHKVLAIWDDRDEHIQKFKKIWQKEEAPSEPGVEDILPTHDIHHSAQQLKLIIDRLGEPFPLPRLLEFSEKCGLYRPHATICSLIQAGIIVPDDEGYFKLNLE